MPEVTLRLRVESDGTVKITDTAQELGNVEKKLLDVANAAKGEASGAMKGLASETGSLGTVLSALGPYGIAAAAALAALAGAAGLVAKVISDSIGEAVAYAGHMTDMAAKTGTTVEAQQELAYAASLVGGSLEGANAAIFKLENALATAPEKFQALGLSAERLKGMKPDEMLTAVGEAAQGIADPIERAAVMQSLLGKGAAENMPLLLSNMREAREHARALGNVMSDETAAALDDLGDHIDTLGQTWDHLFMNLGAALAKNPEFVKSLETITEAVGSLSKMIIDNGPAIANGFNQAFRVFLGTDLITAIKTVSAGIDKLQHTNIFLEDDRPVMPQGWKPPEEFVGPPREQMGPPEQARKTLAEIEAEKEAAKEAVKAAKEAEKAARDAAKAKAEAAKEQEKAIESVAKTIDKMDDSAAKANASLAETEVYSSAIAAGLTEAQAAFVSKQVGLDNELAASLQKLREEYDAALVKAITTGQSTDKLTTSYEDAVTATKDLTAAKQEKNNETEREREKTEAAKKATDDHTAALNADVAKLEYASESLRGISGALQDFGADANSFGVEALNQLADGADIMARSMKNGSLSIADAASAAGSMFAAGKEHGAKGVLGSAAEGAMLGSMFGPQGAVVGAAAGAVISGVGALLGGKSDAEKIGEALGADITDGLAEGIAATADSEGISKALATMLHAADVFKETGLTKPIEDLMNAVALGSVDATEGIDELGDAFDALKTSAEGGNVASEAAMVQMIKRSRELGESIPAIDAFVKETLASVADELDVFYSGQSKGAGGSAQAAANDQIFGAIFDASTAQMGAIEAVDSMAESLNALIAKGGPLTGGAADAAKLGSLLGSGLEDDQRTDEQRAFRGAADAASAAARAMKGLGDTANLSQQTTDAFSTSAKTLYDQALGSSGGDTKSATQAILPLLTQLQHAQAQGAKLTPDSAALLAQAQADGLLPMKTVQEQQLDVLKQIRDGSTGDPASGLPPSNLSGSSVSQIGDVMERAVKAGQGIPTQLSNETVAQLGEQFRLALANAG